MDTPPDTSASSRADSSTGPVRPIKPMRRPSSFRTPVSSSVNTDNPFSPPLSPAKTLLNPFKAPIKPFNPPFSWRGKQPEFTPKDKKYRRRQRKLSLRAQKRWGAQAPHGAPAIEALVPSLPKIMRLPNTPPFQPADAQVLTPTSTAPPITPRLAFALPQPRPLAVPSLPQWKTSCRFQPIVPTGGVVRRPSESSIDSDSAHTSASSLSTGRLSPEEYEQAFDDIFRGTIQGSSSSTRNPFEQSFGQDSNDTVPSQLPLEFFNQRRNAPAISSKPSQVALGKRRASFLDEFRPSVQRRRSTPGARPKPRLFRAPIRSRRQTEPGPMIANTEQLDPFNINMNVHYRILMQELGEHRRLEGQIIQTMDSLNNLTCTALDMTRESIGELEAMRGRLDVRRSVQSTASGVDDEYFSER